MSGLSLEEAGQHLKRLRREVAEAENAFRAQYEESRRSVEQQLQATRSRLEEIERSNQAQLAEAEGSFSSADEADELRREVNITLTRLKAEYAANEAKFREVLDEAAQIIEARPSS
jgi:hypothetical protein